MSDRPIQILLVEDNPADIRLTREALKQCPVPCEVSVVEDGMEAVEFLQREGRFADAPRPDLVLLDLNLPRLSGREVLARIKADPGLRRIPVIVLTTSEAQEDVLGAYDLHANSYVPKPVDLDRFMAVMGVIQTYWLSVVRLPRE